MAAGAGLRQRCRRMGARLMSDGRWCDAAGQSPGSDRRCIPSDSPLLSAQAPNGRGQEQPGGKETAGGGKWQVQSSHRLGAVPCRGPVASASLPRGRHGMDPGRRQRRLLGPLPPPLTPPPPHHTRGRRSKLTKAVITGAAITHDVAQVLTMETQRAWGPAGAPVQSYKPVL